MDSAYAAASLHKAPAACSQTRQVATYNRAMSEAEHPERARPGREITVEDVRQLVGASTPHFALQIRNRIAQLIDGLPGDHPARAEGERELERLRTLGLTGETRGHGGDEILPPLPSLSAVPDSSVSGNRHG